MNDDHDPRSEEAIAAGLPALTRPKPRPAPHRLPTIGEVEALDRIAALVESGADLDGSDAGEGVADILRATGRLAGDPMPLVEADPPDVHRDDYEPPERELPGDEP